MRQYKIWTFTSQETRQVTKYTIGDSTTEEAEFEKLYDRVLRPDRIEFPVSQAFPADVQLQLARLVKDYLNKIEAAKQQAIEQTAIVDLISAAAPTQTVP